MSVWGYARWSNDLFSHFSNYQCSSEIFVWKKKNVNSVNALIDFMQIPMTLSLTLAFQVCIALPCLLLEMELQSHLCYFVCLCVGWGPYAYFQVLEESRSGAQAANMVDMSNAQTTEAEFGNQEEERSSHGFMGLHLADNNQSALTLEEVESGKI